jgi:hypothetical protein
MVPRTAILKALCAIRPHLCPRFNPDLKGKRKLHRAKPPLLRLRLKPRPLHKRRGLLLLKHQPKLSDARLSPAQPNKPRGQPLKRHQHGVH